MARHILSATEASRSLSDILNKVHYQGQSFEIKRGKEIIAKIIPSSSQKRTMRVSELNELLQHLPPLDPEDRKSFAKELKEIRSKTHEENPWD